MIIQCPTCGRVQRRYTNIDIPEARRLAAKGFSVTRAAEMLGVHRATLVKVADDQGIVYQRHRGPYNPRNCARPGEQNGRASLAWEEVERILASRRSSKELASRYGISTVQVNKIRRGAAWRVA